MAGASNLVRIVVRCLSGYAFRLRHEVVRLLPTLPQGQQLISFQFAYFIIIRGCHSLRLSTAV